MIISYEHGLDQMKNLYLKRTREEYLEFLTLEARLRFTLDESRFYGKTSDNSAEQSRISHRLNQISLEKFNVAFTDLCKLVSEDILRHEAMSTMVLIEDGEFIIGAEDTKEEEKPQHTVMLKEFYICRHPVTNLQYQRFVKATGVPAPLHWEGGELPRGKEHHPVVCVTFFSAHLYCIWLRSQTGLPYRLPTETEWEKAARGGLQFDGKRNPHPDRSYSWGNRFERDRCNTLESGHNDTTPVEYYNPKDISIYGISDLMGNVWEWTGSLYRQYPYNPYDGRESANVYPKTTLHKSDRGEYSFESPMPRLDIDADTPVVMRGGSWGLAHQYACCSSRIWSSAGNRGLYGGFRVAGNATTIRGSCGGATRFCDEHLAN